MTAVEHYREAEGTLDAARETNDNPALEAYYLAEAQVHATLALVTYVREVGDQLDTLPRHAGRGVWAAYSDVSGAVVFASEGDALRHAVTRSMQVCFWEYGQFLNEATS